MAERRGFPIGLTVATGIALAILLGLGTWQVQRLHWKRAILARVEALKAAPAKPLELVLDQGEAADFTRVVAICPGIATAPFLELYSIRDGRAGSRLVSACEVASARYRSVLVDRGFVPDTVSARPPVDPAKRTGMAVVGVLRTPDSANMMSPPNRPGRWFTRDVPAMAAALGVKQPAPVFLFAETATNPEWKALTPAPLPAEIPNRHLEYAVTWYGLAVALAGVYLAMLFKRRTR